MVGCVVVVNFVTCESWQETFENRLGNTQKKSLFVGVCGEKQVEHKFLKRTFMGLLKSKHEMDPCTQYTK